MVVVAAIAVQRRANGQRTDTRPVGSQLAVLLRCGNIIGTSDRDFARADTHKRYIIGTRLETTALEAAFSHVQIFFAFQLP